MATLKTSETLIEGLVASKQDGTGNLVEETFKSFDFGENKCAESVSAPVSENGCIDPCNVKGFGQVSQPMKGISLFVQLTGGVPNNVPQHLEKHDLIGNHLDGGSTLDVKGRLSNGNQGEARVYVGDLVWAIVKKQSWWPGIVCDASSAPKEAAKAQKTEDSLLVQCFGNGSYLWCLPHQLKPFVRHFKQLSKKSKSKKFISALENVVAEFGHRVKIDFTCSCFSKNVVARRDDVGDLSVAKFEPATFIGYIKDLARDISVSSKMENAVNQNVSSAFYRSLGHCQLPMHQLNSTNSSKTELTSGVFKEETNMDFFMGDDIKSSSEKSEKANETRERRKSRFLSYPGEHGMKDSMAENNEGLDLNKIDDQPVKKPRKKWCRKQVSNHDLPGKGAQENVCSSEVLFELRCAALDCLFPYESKKFVSVERIIAGFRKLAFNAFTSEIIIEQTKEDTQEQPLSKKVRKRKTKSVSAPISGNNPNQGSLIIDFQKSGSLVLEAQSMVNKRMEVDQGLQNNEVTEPVLGTIFNFSKFADLPATEPPLCELIPKRRKNDVASDTNIHGWNGNFSALLNVNGHMDLEGLSQEATAFQLTNEIGSAPPCFPGSHDVPQVGMISAGPKKRGRKRKNMDLQANSGSMIMPDLNKSGTEKKAGKRGKKNEETGVACIDLVYNKVQQDNEEAKGTAFLLKFSSDHPLPCSQDLNSVFCKYGALNESETQVSNENLSGQIVFLDSSSAGEAFWGLQNDQPFGQALVNYRIQHLSGADSMIGFKTPIKIPGLKPLQQGEMMGSQALIPDLNGSTAESKLWKRSTRIEEIRLPSMDLSYSKLQQRSNGEVTGTALLLKFSPDHPLPSNEDLNMVFCKYGTLDEFETRMLSQNLSGQVVFVNPSSAGEAIQKLEIDRPFGQALVSYRVEHLYSSIRLKNPINNPSGLKPRSQQGATPDLAVIRKNLEMMRSMLEKAGDSLTPEMRWKLESEIKGLMNKLITMDASSSSSL